MGGKWCGKQCFPLFGKQRKKERMENREKNCGEKIALTVKLHKCPLPPTLLTNTTAVLESSKKKKNQRPRAGEKKIEKALLE